MLDIIIKEHSEKLDKLLEELSIIKQQNLEIMASFADLQASVAALTTAVAALPASGGAITSAQADTIKVGIDAATAAITGIETPAPSSVVAP